MNNLKVFRVPGKAGIIDFAVVRDGQLVSEFEGKAVQRMEKDYPGVVLSSYEEALAATDALIKTQPEEISEEIYREALECLPPLHWQAKGGVESFKFCEYYCGNVTAIYVRHGKRYFSLRNDADLTHEQIVSMVEKVFFH